MNERSSPIAMENRAANRRLQIPRLDSQISNRQWTFSNVQAAIRLTAIALLLGMARTSPAIDFFPTLDAAADANPGDSRARVLIFGSQSCGWCRKLAADTLVSPIVTESAECFLWIRIDVDENEELAARYGVRGLPHTTVVDEFGNVLGELPGYMPAQEFVEFLMQAVTQPPPTILETELLLFALREGDVAACRTAVRKLMDQVSRVEATGRDQAIATVKELDPDHWAEFVPYLSHPRLSIRATAHGLLTRGSPVDLPFDPFAPAADREPQVQQWVAWMKERGAQVPPLELPDPPAESSHWPMSGDSPPPPPEATRLNDDATAAE
jgi:thioredoxin-related protein